MFLINFLLRGTVTSLYDAVQQLEFVYSLVRISKFTKMATEASLSFKKVM